MTPTVYGIFEIPIHKYTGNTISDFQFAKFRQWNYLDLESKQSPYEPKPEHRLIRVEFDEPKLLPFHTGKEFVKFAKSKIKNNPDEISVKYL